MTTSERWLTLLRTEAERTSIAAAAALLGYSRTSISLVLARLDKQSCPHLGEQISTASCREIALAAAPTHHPLKLGHWRACQRCPKRPQGD